MEHTLMHEILMRKTMMNNQSQITRGETLREKGYSRENFDESLITRQICQTFPSYGDPINGAVFDN